MKRSEKGRSMVEMLGVLAIIGVLSVGGIYGYSVAMRKHKANEIIQVASMLSITAETKNNGEGDCLNIDDDGVDLDIPADVEDMQADQNGNVQIQFADTDSGIGAVVKQMLNDQNGKIEAVEKITIDCNSEEDEDENGEEEE